jgi:hypothetical protein
MKHVAPGSHGLFRLVNRAMLKAQGLESFPAFVADLRRRHPLQLKGEPRPLIREGALCLNDPAAAQVCLAVLEVSRPAAAILR